MWHNWQSQLSPPYLLKLINSFLTPMELGFILIFKDYELQINEYVKGFFLFLSYPTSSLLLNTDILVLPSSTYWSHSSPIPNFMQVSMIIDLISIKFHLYDVFNGGPHTSFLPFPIFSQFNRHVHYSFIIEYP